MKHMERCNEAKKRMENHMTKIVEALKNAGEKGCTNFTLQKITGRMNNTLSYLYMQGYQIEVTFLGDGVYNYVLISEPSNTETKYSQDDFMSAYDVLMGKIKELGKKSITIEELNNILDTNHLSVCRKKGYFKKGIHFNNMK